MELVHKPVLYQCAVELAGAELQDVLTRLFPRNFLGDIAFDQRRVPRRLVR